jgi:cytosine/adenosine deaminase-related metal-dependent hydrolase
MLRRIAIHAGYVIAYDGRGHRLLRDGAVMVEGDRIVSVGPRPATPAGADVEIVEARDAILTPGLI